MKKEAFYSKTEIFALKGSNLSMSFHNTHLFSENPQASQQTIKKP
ncbi:hypothetical protein SAMN05421820_101536 [Pedobacter steynii]|uniref:Uncharacterized protein n=1 Tax=Pedobacter steynii TaxID=430522 RepID=A0A1G9KBN0_9SPHI|nr:hypothetical protein [Pedobacter steynii]SDL47340.1 hypothetical protein SAMN05421820_101536 [Pedobacter steynii]